MGHPLTSSAAAWLAGVFDRAAPTYDEVPGGYHEHFGRRLVALADVREGHRVLDVACGCAWKWSYSLRGPLEQLPAERVEQIRHDAQPHLDRAMTPEGLPITLTALMATAATETFP